MKTLIEGFKSFLNEQKEQIDLYHVSSVPDLSVLDPALSVSNRKNFSKREYQTWDRPRIFYFTKMGQEDTGIGRIKGYPYRALIGKNELYPILKDPLKLSYPENEEEYKKIREEEEGIPPYYRINRFEMVATLGSRRHGFKGFIYPQSGNSDNMIAAIWEPLAATKIEHPFYKITVGS
jgi:hypothetical protein